MYNFKKLQNHNNDNLYVSDAFSKWIITKYVHMCITSDYNNDITPTSKVYYRTNNVSLLIVRGCS